MADEVFDAGFERRLERQLRDIADEGVRPFDAVAITRMAAAGAHVRPRLFPTWWRTALAFALLTVALVGAGIAGGFIRLPTNDLLPNPSFAPFSPPPNASASPSGSASPGPGTTPLVTLVPVQSGAPVGTPPATAPVATGPVATGPAATAAATTGPVVPPQSATPSMSPPATAAPVPTEPATHPPIDTPEPSASPEPPASPLATPAPVTAVTSIAVGDDHGCAVAEDGRIFCWGANSEGQLGDGTQSYRDFGTVPVADIDDGVAVSAGIAFSCAIRSDGSVWCWGADPGSDDVSSVPLQVAGIEDATQVTAGGAFACALRVGGSVACWGNGQIGQLGNGVFENNSGVAEPQPVLGIEDAIQISSGWNHTCALLRDRTIRCWGGNGDGATGYGQLGDGTLDNSATPVVVVGLDDVVEVRAGGWSTCAIRREGTVWCWGYGEAGTLGNGTTQSSSVPVQASGIGDARNLAVGRFHACASSTDDRVWCWGDIAWGGAPAGGPVTEPTEGTRAVAASALATDRYLLILDRNGTVWWWGFGSVNVPEEWPVGP